MLKAIECIFLHCPIVTLQQVINLNKDDHVLIVDDFLANGCAVLGLIDLVEQAGAQVEGVGIVIEKGYQSGGQMIREKGYHLESLAIIESMNDETGMICFREDEK